MIKRSCVMESDLDVAGTHHTTTPVAIKRIPTKKPRWDTIFTNQRNGFPITGERPNDRSRSQEAEATPPKISVNGTLANSRSDHKTTIRHFAKLRLACANKNLMLLLEKKEFRSDTLTLSSVCMTHRCFPFSQHQASEGLSLLLISFDR